MSHQENEANPTPESLVWLNDRISQLRNQRNKARDQIYALDMEIHRSHQTIHGLGRNLNLALQSMDQLNAQLKSSQEETKEKTMKIRELEEYIAKQKVTIRLQSDKISVPGPSSPRHIGLNPRAPIFERPPPVYNQPQPIVPFPHPGPVELAASRPLSGNDPSVPSWIQNGNPSAMSAQMSSAPSRAGPTPGPYPRMQSISPMTPVARTPHAHRPEFPAFLLPAKMDAQQARDFAVPRSLSRNTSTISQGGLMEEQSAFTMRGGIAGAIGAMNLQDEGGTNGIHWPAEFSGFFKLTEEFARNYTNIPNECQDRQLGEDILGSMRRQSSGALVIPLLASGATRYFLIARLMNTWITNDVFRGHVFANFSPDFDQKFFQANQINPDAPIHVRAGLLRDVADAAKQMQSRSAFPNFLSSVIREKVLGVWERLTPLFAPGILNSQAFEDMMYLMNEAFRVALLMMTTPLVYKIEFPTSSPNTYFQPNTMINRDPHMRDNPLTLAQAGTVVRLGITPLVVVTSFTGPSIYARTVHFANVLLQSHQEAAALAALQGPFDQPS